MKPHDNPHWKAKRQEKDIERILQDKPVSNSDFHVTRAPNVYVLMLKLLFSRESKVPRRAVLSALLAGLLRIPGKREPEPQAEPELRPDIEEFPF
jgi:hypothetical protein